MRNSVRCSGDLAVLVCTGCGSRVARWTFQYDIVNVPQSAGSFEADIAKLKEESRQEFLRIIVTRTRGKAYRDRAKGEVADAMAASIAGGIPGIGSIFQAAAARAAADRNVSDIKAIQAAAVEGYAAQRRLGTWYHVAYVDGTVRVDDIESATAYIYEPGQVIFLDLALQTTATMPQEWMVDPPANQTAATDPMCAPGTVKKSAGRTISGIPTTRYDLAWPSLPATLFMAQYPTPHVGGTYAGVLDPLALLHACAAPALRGDSLPKEGLVMYSAFGTFVFEVGNFRTTADPSIFAEPQGFKRLN